MLFGVTSPPGERLKANIESYYFSDSLKPPSSWIEPPN